LGRRGLFFVALGDREVRGNVMMICRRHEAIVT
jgi:hypothetical protein